LTLDPIGKWCIWHVGRNREFDFFPERYLFSQGVAKSAGSGNLFECSSGLRPPAKCEITSGKL
jgi:hypothetical protein